MDDGCRDSVGSGRVVGLVLSLLWLLAGCGGDGPAANQVEQDVEPDVRLGEVVEVTETSALATGTVVAVGDPPAVDYGICLDREVDPSVGSANCKTLGEPEEPDDFSVELTGLEPGASYRVRTVATTRGLEHQYGETVEFSTDGSSRPVVETGEVLEVTEDGAVVEGEVVDVGQPPGVGHGICVDTSAEPTVGDSRCQHWGDIEETGSFSVEFTDLESSEIYFARAYATTEDGDHHYGAFTSFTTHLEAPAQLEASSGDFPDRVALEWDEVEEATAYEVYRDGEYVETVLETEYEDEGATPPTLDDPGHIEGSDGPEWYSVELEVTDEETTVVSGEYHVVAIIDGQRASQPSPTAEGYRDGIARVEWKRAESEDEDVQPVGQSDGARFVDGDLGPGDWYYRAVVATDDEPDAQTETTELASVQPRTPDLLIGYSRHMSSGYQGNVLSIDAQGNKNWKTDIYDLVMDVTVAPDGDVLSTGGSTYRFDDAGGVEMEFEDDGEDFSGEAVTVDEDGVVYLASDDDHLVKVDGASGEEQWRRELVGASSVAVDAAGTICAGLSSDVRRYDQDGNNVGIWSTYFDGPLHEIVHDGMGYVAVVWEDGVLIREEFGAGGSDTWMFEELEAPRSTAIDRNGDIYVADAEAGEVVKVDGDNGELIWRSYVDDEPSFQNVAVDPGGYVYATAASTLYALDREGHERWSRSLSDLGVEWSDYDYGMYNFISDIVPETGEYGATPDPWTLTD